MVLLFGTMRLVPYALLLFYSSYFYFFTLPVPVSSDRVVAPNDESELTLSSASPGEEGAFLSLKHLPPLVQTQDRVLVANVLAPRDRPHLLAKHLHNLVNMCELGFEVHVVLITGSTWANNSIHMYEPSFYRCNRLAQDLPIVEAITSRRITSFHRNVFTYMKDKYDYYIDHEDDVMFTPQHLVYFKKWVDFFQGTNYLPGFAVGEVLVNRAKHLGLDTYTKEDSGSTSTSTSTSIKDTNKERSNDGSSSRTSRSLSTTTDSGSGRGAEEVASFYRDSDMFWQSFTAHDKRGMHITAHRGVPLLYLEKAWNPGYIMTRHMLHHFALQPEWFSDRKRSYNEVNTHYQHLWLARHFRIVIPIQDFRHSLVHHAPNKYVQGSFAGLLVSQRNSSEEVLQQMPYSTHMHNHAVAVAEMEAALDVCMGDSMGSKSQQQQRSSSSSSSSSSSIDTPTSTTRGRGAGSRPWRIDNMTYVVSGDIKRPSPLAGCAACISQGKATYANFNFLGSAETALRRRAASVVVELRCDGTLITQEHSVDATKELRLDAWELGANSVRLTTMGSGTLHRSDAYPIYMHPVLVNNSDSGRYEDPAHSAFINQGITASPLASAPVSDYVWAVPKGSVHQGTVKMTMMRQAHRYPQARSALRPGTSTSATSSTTTTMHRHYPGGANFTAPRRYNGTATNHLRSSNPINK